MSVNLRFSTHIHDTFLHLPTALYMKLYNQIAPLIQLNLDENLVFWCVKDLSIQDNTVHLNSKMAEHLGLKNDSYYNISIGPFKFTNLRKVMVSLPKGSDDWKLLHEDFESLQSQILEQCRLVKRRNQFPIYSNSRKAPLWIKVEEFGGYQSPEKLGIISDDTELVFVDSPNELGRTDDNNAYSFIVVPSSGFDFVCNPAQTIANVCSFQSHQFLVRKCEKVPRGVLLIPDIILNEVFRVSPKDEIDILASVSTALEFSGIIHYSVDGATCNFEAGKHLNETIIAAPNGIAVKSFANESSQIHRFKTPASLESNSFSEFISQTKHRMILFHGQSGCGKSKAVADAIQYLNYSSSYLFKIVYIDLMTTDLYINSDIDLFSTIIFDHADEYLQIESDAEDEVTRKYVNMCRYISELLSMHKTAKVVLVSRSSKAFSRLSSAFSLRFDYSFRLEASKGWSFDVNPEPLISVFGLEEAKSSLHRLILNPLQFYRVYAANNMDLHSSILMSGPTGSGKTHLALKFLEHHDIRFIHIHGPEILDKYVGSSEKGVRDIFTRARNLKPCVILFDEFDSLVPKRGSNQSGVTDRIVNQFLTELDGTEDRSGVFIIATTSRPDLIDKAIIRPGRIDQRIELSYPKIDEIKEFLSEKGLSFKKMKAFLRILASNSNLALSWADLKSIGWEDPSSALSSLLKSVSIRVETQNKISEATVSTQRLTLA